MFNPLSNTKAYNNPFLCERSRQIAENPLPTNRFGWSVSSHLPLFMKSDVTSVNKKMNSEENTKISLCFREMNGVHDVIMALESSSIFLACIPLFDHTTVPLIFGLLGIISVKYKRNKICQYLRKKK